MNEQRIKPIIPRTTKDEGGNEVVWEQGYSRFDADIHVPLLIEVFDDGDGAPEFCKRAKISESTFVRWIQCNPIFKETHEKGLAARRAYIERVFKENYVSEGTTKVNQALIIEAARMFMRYSPERHIQIEGFTKDNSFDQNYEAITNFIASGKANRSEIKALAEFVQTGLKIKEFTELKADVEQLKELIKHRDDEFEEGSEGLTGDSETAP